MKVLPARQAANHWAIEEVLLLRLVRVRNRPEQY
jgi:hypothetical protein